MPSAWRRALWTHGRFDHIGQHLYVERVKQQIQSTCGKGYGDSLGGSDATSCKGDVESYQQNIRRPCFVLEGAINPQEQHNVGDPMSMCGSLQNLNVNGIRGVSKAWQTNNMNTMRKT